MSEVIELTLRINSIVGDTSAFSKIASSLGIYDKQVSKLNERLEAQAAITRQALASVASYQAHLARGYNVTTKLDIATKTYNDSLQKQIAIEKQLTAEMSKRLSMGGGGGKDTKTLLSGLASYGAYFAIKEVGKVISETTRDTLAYSNSIRLLSQLTGLATKDASVYALAAKEVGITTETVGESFRTFSDRMARSTGEFGTATAGSKSMEKAMSELGVSAKDANGNMRSMNDVLPEIFAGFERIGPGVQATALATALFGRNADELLPLLLNGATGLEQVRSKAEALGIMLEDKTTVQIRELQKAFVDLDAAGIGMKIMLTEGVTPAIQAMGQMAVMVAPYLRSMFMMTQAGVSGGILGFIDAAVKGRIQDIPGDILKHYNDIMRSFLPSPGVSVSGGAQAQARQFGASALTPNKGKPPSGGAARESLSSRLASIEADYLLKESRVTRDFQDKQKEQMEDFMRDRQKMIEQDGEERLKLETKINDNRKKLTEKWDEILLRLQVGGDTESIELAKIKREEAMREQDTDDKDERDELIAKQDEQIQLKQEDFDIRRQRQLEDYNIARADSLLDYQNRRMDEEENYAKSLSAQAEYQGFATQIHQGGETQRTGITLEESWKRKLAAEAEAQAVIDALNRVKLASQMGGPDKYGPYLPTDKYSSWASGGTINTPWAPDWWTQYLAGTRAFGGIVPGALGSAQLMLVHGGERITPPATSSYYNNVRAGNQVSINAPMTFTNTVNGLDPNSMSRYAARQLSRQISNARSFMGR